MHLPILFDGQGSREPASEIFCPLQSTISDDAFISEVESISNAASAEAATSNTDSKAGKVGKATTEEIDNSQAAALFTKTGKKGNSTTDTLFTKTGKRSGKAEQLVPDKETTQATHQMSLHFQGDVDVSVLRKGKSDKDVRDNSRSKSQKKK